MKCPHCDNEDKRLLEQVGWATPIYQHDRPDDQPHFPIPLVLCNNCSKTFTAEPAV
jgi:hypothetical protein